MKENLYTSPEEPVALQEPVCPETSAEVSAEPLTQPIPGSDTEMAEVVETRDEAELAPPPLEVPLPHAKTEAEKKKERRGLVGMLICVVFATVAVIVYGVSAADKLSSISTPIPEMLLSEVLGKGVTKLGSTYSWPPLVRIPPQTVEDGVPPGAAEHETLPEVSEPPASGELLPIRAVDLSVSAEDVFAVINETPYEPDTLSLYASDPEIPSVDELHASWGEDAPIVLIIHTHGTESYSPQGAEDYDSGESFRSADPDDGVVSVGRAVKAVFEEHGIGVIHLETMFDLEDYNAAYYNAALEIRRITEEYPSVSYVFDIHRDAMITSDGVNLKPTSPSVNTVDGVSAAQIMLVVGTDHAGSGHTEWQDNMATALKIQKSALGFDPGIMRPLNLRSASFNEQYTKGSLLVEIGAAANSVEEARLAGTIFAEAAVRVMTERST